MGDNKQCVEISNNSNALIFNVMYHMGLRLEHCHIFKVEMAVQRATIMTRHKNSFYAARWSFNLSKTELIVSQNQFNWIYIMTNTIQKINKY
jgi:hypothetical protein